MATDRMGPDNMARNSRRSKQPVGSNLPRRLRSTAARAMNRIADEVGLQRELADAWGVHEGTASKWVTRGEPLYRLGALVYLAESHGIDTAAALEYLHEVRMAAKFAALPEDEVRRRLDQALYDEHEAEMVENRSVDHFRKTGCYRTLIEGFAGEKAVQGKAIAYATVAQERGIAWGSR